jgi:hypothetical protein
MKANLIALIMTLAITGFGAEKIQSGPKGGRILGKTEPKAEFFLEKDRTATITFYDAKSKPVEVKDQSVAITVGKQKIEFEKKKDQVLVSKSKLPEGDALPIVVQLKQSGEAKPQNFRFKLDTSICGGCKLAEYACTCH